MYLGIKYVVQLSETFNEIADNDKLSYFPAILPIKVTLPFGPLARMDIRDVVIVLEFEKFYEIILFRSSKLVLLKSLAISCNA